MDSKNAAFLGTAMLGHELAGSLVNTEPKKWTNSSMMRDPRFSRTEWFKIASVTRRLQIKLIEKASHGIDGKIVFQFLSIEVSASDNWHEFF